MAPYGMLTELQTIFLTCLLGPEDPKAFSRFQRAAKRKEKYWEDPEKERKAAREQMRKHRIEKPESGVESRRKYAEKNPTAARDSMRKRREEHPEEVREVRNNWRQENLLRCKSVRNKRQRERYSSDASYRAQSCLKNRLNNAIKRGMAKKSARTMELTGCPWVWLEVHLESLFKLGMTWENQGAVWQIDHVRPCASFDLTDPEQQKICFHWTNLQPLFAAENLAKGDTYVV